MTTTECRNCEGKGRTLDTRHASITHAATTVRRTCRYCKGTGVLVIDDRPLYERRADESTGEIPDWMTEGVVS